MTDFYDDYSSFIAAKSLPASTDTPYHYPRSKRSSRATFGSSRGQSTSPPPLPPDAMELHDRGRDARFNDVDPRRFTPTLHASLVSDILNLRRELDSKNNLVENLETSLLAAKQETESLAKQLAVSAKETRVAKRHVQQIEKGTYDVVESLAEERDAARKGVEELKSKLDVAQKTARQQDEDSIRTQRIWESEKENWEKERRQLERRVHVTEARLRTFVDELSSHQQQANSGDRVVHVEDEAGDSVFKDSGLGNESDTASVQSPPGSPAKQHRRNISSISYSSRRSRGPRSSMIERNLVSPDPQGRPGYSLADELGIDGEGDGELDDFDQVDPDLEYPEVPEHVRQTMESRQSNNAQETDEKAKRVLGLTPDMATTSVDPDPTSKPASPTPDNALNMTAQPVSEPDFARPLSTVQEESQPRSAHYVDSACQPSPPTSPVQKQQQQPRLDTSHDIGTEAARLMAASPLSPPDSPSVDQRVETKKANDVKRKVIYATAATQTEPEAAKERPTTPTTQHRQRNSLSPPSFVPAIAIHPPTSRPSTPRNYVLPPRTKNASTQANVATPWSSRSVSVQTEEIRVDRRAIKLPLHLMPSHLLPSPTLAETASTKRASEARTSELFIYRPTSPVLPTASPPSPPPQPPRAPWTDSSELQRDDSQKDLRSMPLKVLPLPRPTLSPAGRAGQAGLEGPLNRSSSYGVSQPTQIASSRLADVDKDSDLSDLDEAVDQEFEPKNFAEAVPGISRKLGRIGILDYPKAVPEDKEISPERRPETSGSTGAAPAPSIASSRPESQRAKGKQPAKSAVSKSVRSRSPSFGSLVSSSHSTSTKAGVPPYPIPTRSSSRVIPNSFSEGSQSPTPFHSSNNSYRPYHKNRTNNLRKVQSASGMRHGTRRTSPNKSRRHRRSPDLTPVQSMAFDSPAGTDFPIPEIPTSLPENSHHQRSKSSMAAEEASATERSSTTQAVREPNLVDAIAATMVGEWMLKYIRKRKSFGVGETEFSLNGEDALVGAAHGSRHKRWVWLSPYDRCIMWDNKQPSSGTALLGKKGRKLAIQSVLDVQDETPAPRNAEFPSAFNRSILILTPERALKFTAVSHERHALWMTALSFLAGSGASASGAPSPSMEPPVPHLPPVDSLPEIRRQPPSFGRGAVRDSIRLAKGKRPELPKKAPAREPDAVGPTMSPALEDVLQGDHGADFPAVPRLYVGTNKHQRKRSNTSPRVPPALSGLRSLSSSAAISSSSSSQYPLSSFRPGMLSKSAGGSRNESVATASQDGSNFFEAVGTVRMAAFVDPNLQDGVLYVPAPPQASQQPLRSNGTAAPIPNIPVRRRGDSNLSQATVDHRRGGFVFDDVELDPFKNF